jgi:hypothetical protein
VDRAPCPSQARYEARVMDAPHVSQSLAQVVAGLPSLASSWLQSKSKDAASSPSLREVSYRIESVLFHASSAYAHLQYVHVQ